MTFNPAEKRDNAAPLSATILAGGSGTRFWPLSTDERPKQFLQLFGERTMLQHTFDRLHGLVPPERILILTNARYVPLVREQLPEVPPENVIGEPIPRDTSAAVALGSLIAQYRWGDHVMLALPADHAIEPVDRFQAALRSAAEAAWQSSSLYTFGIDPTYPATGYGYLESGERIAVLEPHSPDDLQPVDEPIEHFKLLRFKEKPDLETAAAYVASGRFYWNSGMFVWSAQAILSEIERHLPRHLERLAPLGAYVPGDAWDRRLEEALEPLPKVSIDFGVMEKAADVRMVKAPFAWNDVGGWAALREYLAQDSEGNFTQGDVHPLDAQGNIVYCDAPNETVALVGVRDLVVVRAGRRTLVVHQDKLEDVKKLVAGLNVHVENSKGGKR